MNLTNAFDAFGSANTDGWIWAISAIALIVLFWRKSRIYRKHEVGGHAVKKYRYATTLFRMLAAMGATIYLTFVHFAHQPRNNWPELVLAVIGLLLGVVSMAATLRSIRYKWVVQAVLNALVTFATLTASIDSAALYLTGDRGWLMRWLVGWWANQSLGATFSQIASILVWITIITLVIAAIVGTIRGIINKIKSVRAKRKAAKTGKP